MTSSIRGRLLRALVGTAATLAAAACGNSPSAPTAGAPAGVATSAVSLPETHTADLGACLGGNGDASCFKASSSVRTAATVQPATVNSPPTNLAYTASGSTVVLSWTAPVTGDPVLSYIIEAGSAPGLTNLANFSTGNPLATLTAPGVPNGTYYVRVRALNVSGASLPSNEVIVVVGSTGTCAGPPRNLAVVSQTAGTISISWSPPTTGSPTSYVIRAGSSPGLSNLADFDTGNPSLSFVTSGVPAGSYYVRVYSRSACGVSTASNEALVFVGFTGDVQVSVSWDAPSDVDLHVVEPNGNEIYYDSPTSSTGGQLDVDSNAACSIDGRQIENIRWGSQAPAGTYIVRVDYWDGCNVARTNYLVTVKNGSSVQTFSGFFTGAGDHGGGGSGVLITTFFHAASHLVPARVLEMFRAPDLFTPSSEKLRLSGIAH